MYVYLGVLRIISLKLFFLEIGIFMTQTFYDLLMNFSDFPLENRES